MKGAFSKGGAHHANEIFNDSFLGFAFVSCILAHSSFGLLWRHSRNRNGTISRTRSKPCRPSRKAASARFEKAAQKQVATLRSG
jgi:hypothetical protein